MSKLAEQTKEIVEQLVDSGAATSSIMINTNSKTGAVDCMVVGRHEELVNTLASIFSQDPRIKELIMQGMITEQFGTPMKETKDSSDDIEVVPMSKGGDA